ncbi:MAG: PAS domain S-box protein [Microcoleus sp.]
MMIPPDLDIYNIPCPPIHSPGYIQSHGILFVLEEPLLKIVRVSNNIGEVLNLEPHAILGKCFDEFVVCQKNDSLSAVFSEKSNTTVNIILHLKHLSTKQVFNGKYYRTNNCLVVELEPRLSTEYKNFFNLFTLIKKTLTKIQNARDIKNLYQIVAQETRKIIGFDRVIVYQFDTVDAGEVVAEDKVDSLNPLLGLHYPDTDIPQLARHLATHNLIRFIPDINFQPVEIISADNPLNNQPLDLSLSSLRSVSPCHIEYLKNLGVAASLTMSIIKDKKLWGLIACHHREPKYVSYEVRTACEQLAKIIALELSVKKDSEDREYEAYLKSIFAEFTEDISRENRFAEGLLQHKERLLELVGASGAVLCAKENLTPIGKTPELADIQQLITWVETQLNNDIFYTDSLPKAYPKSEKFKEVASGLLVMAISQMQKHYILWFRPEVIQNVNWAGKLNSTLESESATSSLSPRNSFELWQQTVRLKSLPWKQCEIAIAQELRVTLVGIELRRINQQLTLALSATKMGFWDWDLQKNYITLSREYEQLFGLAPGTFDGSCKNWAECIHPEDLTDVRNSIAVARSDRQDYVQEYRVLWSDGSIHWIEARGKFFYSEEREAVRMVGTVIEISDRKAKELQLRLLESVVTTTNDAVLITEAGPIDEPGPRIIYVNPAFTRISGYTLEEVIGKTPRILQGEKTDRASLERIRTALIDWQPVRVDLINYRKDGTEFWVELSIVPIADETGWFTHWVAVQRDISGRKEAENALQQLNEELEIRVWERTLELEKSQAEVRQSEALFRSLSESSPVGIFKIDAEGKFIYANPRLQAIFGFTLAEALGEGWMKFVHPEDINRILSLWSAAQSLDRELACQFRHIRPDGTIRFCRVKTAPIISEEGQLIGHVGTAIDITESQEIDKMKNEFISIVSHELRTPLTSIRGSLGLLAAGVLKNQPETAQQMLEIAKNDTERLVRLVNDILDLERLDSSQVTLNKQWYDAADLIQESVKSVQALADESKINLSILSRSAQIWVERDRIVQMLVNLLSNAIKFSPALSTVTVSVEDWGDRVLCQVKDSGRGIPADKLENIFGRFQQVDASDSRQKGGTGLGLAICRSIVQQHGGRIWAESLVGEGSSFYFTLPAPSFERGRE